MTKQYDPGLAVIDEDSLVLHRNENLFIEREWLDQLIKQAALETDIRFYPDTNYGQLRTALAELHQVDLENIYVGNGAEGVLADVLGCLRNNYRELVTLDICFPVFGILGERHKYNITKLNRNNVSQIQENQLVIIDSPNSITGEVFSNDVLDSILRKKNSFLIWDNVYGEFNDDKITSLPDNLLIVKSFSKYYGLAGLRLGYCIGSKDLIERLFLYKEVYNVNCIVEQMALQVLRNKDQFEVYKNRMHACKKKMEHILRELGFDLTDSKGNFVFMEHPKHSAEWLEKKLSEKNILARRFSQSNIENCLRVAVPPEDKLTYFLESLQGILQGF